jgi:NifB/MoaA-like Fe-S oxidoreductase
MVIVPGLNDGEVLEESLNDLWNLDDAVLTTAVVPVGLTQFSHLYTGRGMDASYAGELLDRLHVWSARAFAERGHAWVFGSDELYLLAGRALPGAGHYSDFPQIENGVGAVTFLRTRVARGIGQIARMDGRTICVVTGLAMRSILPPILQSLAEASGARFEMIAMENSLFGPTTTASGLLPGSDILAALRDRRDADLGLIPAETINDSGVFLDDREFVAVREACGMPVRVSHDFLDVLAPREGAGPFAQA